MDQLTAMRQFVAVVEAGSFSAAARRLGLGQPAISKTVAALERRLGVKLLLRTSRAQQPTDAGRRFYERARNVLEEAEAAEAEARAAATTLTGRLRVSAAPVYASTQIVPRLGAFLDAHPALDVELVLDDRRIDLIEEGIDLAIRAGELDDSTLTARRIDHSRRRVVAAPDYLRRHGRPQRPSDLGVHAAIGYTGFSPAAWTFERDGQAERASVAPRLTVSAADALVAAARAGLGCALVSERMVARELASGDLVAVLEDWDAGGSDVWAIFPAGRRPTARARTFVDWLAQALAPVQ